jgi:hypothetical protein
VVGRVPRPATRGKLSATPGASTAGGSDANGVQGRDKMPDPTQGVRHLNKQNKPDKM